MVFVEALSPQWDIQQKKELKNKLRRREGRRKEGGKRGRVENNIDSSEKEIEIEQMEPTREPISMWGLTWTCWQGPFCNEIRDALCFCSLPYMWAHIFILYIKFPMRN